jgi:hypothetical protein
MNLAPLGTGSSPVHVLCHELACRQGHWPPQTNTRQGKSQVQRCKKGPDACGWDNGASGGGEGSTPPHSGNLMEPGQAARQRGAALWAARILGCRLICRRRHRRPSARSCGRQRRRSGGGGAVGGRGRHSHLRGAGVGDAVCRWGGEEGGGPGQVHAMRRRSLSTSGAEEACEAAVRERSPASLSGRSATPEPPCTEAAHLRSCR